MIALLAAILERIVGYPAWLTDRIGHPVIWIGKLIEMLDQRQNDPEKSFGSRRIAGVVAIATVVLTVLVVTLGLQQVLRFVPFGWLVEILLASTLIAQKGLRDAVLAVARALGQQGIDAARREVAHIVGRDTAELDEAEISRAAIETLAENTSDGVIAPLLFLALFGLPGAAIYKAINTADSMIGHRSERYAAFGWAAAKLDDLVNFIPARLTAGLFALAARAMPGADTKAAWEAARRDAPHHASPNAGWPEAAMAGALGFGLGGPRAYKGETLDLPKMGEGKRNLTADDIATAISLYDRAMLIALGILAAWALFSIVF
ncbi:adenosylcobinamide-phosphate synthase CbiB [Pelagibacterium halotolerans]|uniref:Cobalamin biosynthesis protein CobD n=1 Tax=Pelagibacterium halotolerans (strain DSM 22347 / JCM 15775 / CGMCC 1.7692 / B2) TaxID=1082931 RepID=G4REJ4_PELHB|nr:adenosylcobinamide-phosphate synthase CbiB [Pelagibacterium halotolerans]AEQ53926.1 adenosylcobinamide-phosphate synthase [Pelagibacterium halotolerans B2]QJR19933.1 cobalamin biosynthesis protein CobD [Pelagibacterium halotolerans]SEA46740.1 adenosylcobinamide-phosphate synthase [Pelagibacterium halotolerans]